MAISQVEEMELQNILRQVGLDQLKEGSLCIFAGAGISINSGIPRASKIIEYVVDQIFDDEQDKSLFLSPQNKIPFEVFMELLFNNYQPPISKSTWMKVVQNFIKFNVVNDNGNNFLHYQFFELFNSKEYQPNSNHCFIAEMLRKGICSFAVTTNFDLMIEEAYKIITGKELRVYFPKPGQKIKYEFPCLLKLHGGCQDLGTIQTTLGKIVDKEAVAHCEAMVDYTFRNGKHSIVMVIGYSFSDVFDIIPAIERVNKSNIFNTIPILKKICRPKKKIVKISHSVEYPSSSPICKLPFFQNFSGWEVKANTNAVISSLQELYPSEKPCPEPFSTPEDSENIDAENIDELIRDWAVGL